MKYHFERDIGIVAISVLVAILLAKNGVLKSLIDALEGWRILGSILIGMFFVSVFTVAPASVALVKIAQVTSPLEVAFLAGIGGLLGDFLIFRFVKDSLSDDVRWLAKRMGLRKFHTVMRRGLTRWLMPLVGALIVASPFPDEIGLALMGVSRMRISTFILISFTLNFLGILATISLFV